MACNHCGFYCSDATREDCPHCGTYYEDAEPDSEKDAKQTQ